MSDKDRPSSEEIAFRGLANFRQPTEAEIQRGIDAAMADVIRRDARHNPNALDPPARVQVVGAPTVVDADSPRQRGWVDPKPLEPPPGQDVIERLVNAALPHGPESKAK